MQEKIQFIFPIDGDCLNDNDGVNNDEYLSVKVKIKSDSQFALINGVQAENVGGMFETHVKIAFGKNVITATADGESKTIIVYRLKNASAGYRFSVDDNILFLKDLNDNKSGYRSIFDNKYLSLFKKAHDDFGTKAQLNLFYETEDLKGFSYPIEYFNLSMMTDKYKDEFIKNSDWLKMSFHSRKENPPYPYENDLPQVVADDIDRINSEIVRFAGRECLAAGTTIHYGSVNNKNLAEVKKHGYGALAGFFEIKNGKPVVSYNYPPELVEYIGTRDFWCDNKIGILFSHIDCVLNYFSDLQTAVSELKKIDEKSGYRSFIDIMIHEQYFYPAYERHILQFTNIVLGACKWLSEKGYKSRFLEEVFNEYAATM